MFGYFSGLDNDVFDQFERLRREMNQIFGDPSGAGGIRSMVAGSYPPVNVGASAEQVDVYVFAAGIDPDSLNLALQQNQLTIAGERRTERAENVQLYRSERFNGSFHRVITLPEDVDPDKVNASYLDGILHLTVRRLETVKPRQIEVK
jgi:HSP20 family protein